MLMTSQRAFAQPLHYRSNSKKADFQIMQTRKSLGKFFSYSLKLLIVTVTTCQPVDKIF